MKLIDDLKKLEAEATLDWEYIPEFFSIVDISGDEIDQGNSKKVHANLEFSAAARNATPKLIAAIEKMEEALRDCDVRTPPDGTGSLPMACTISRHALTEVRKILDGDA